MLLCFFSPPFLPFSLLFSLPSFLLSFPLGERPLNLRMPDVQNRQPHHFVVDGELSRLYSSEAKSHSSGEDAVSATGKNLGDVPLALLNSENHRLPEY